LPFLDPCSVAAEADEIINNVAAGAGNAENASSGTRRFVETLPLLKADGMWKAMI
jgi:hypothetical protein